MRKFLYGLATGIIVIPLVGSLLEVAYSWFEVLKIKPASIVNEWNKKVAAESGDDVSAIGFQINNDTEEYDEEEE
jgi:hypothetical protein|nr:MAG TPA: hypothetical protein [Caudoviricetes sp.]